MAITLEEAKVGMADHVDQQVIDTFQRSSLLLERMTFDNAISPGTGGSTLAYGYTQLKTPATAGVRAINSEYTANEAKREKKTANAVGHVFRIGHNVRININKEHTKCNRDKQKRLKSLCNGKI